MINKSWCNVAVWFIFFWHSIRFLRINLNSVTKIFTVFFSWYKTKQYWNIPEEKYFAPLRILNLFIKSFANLFVDLALTFFDISFNIFSSSTCFVLFEVTFLYIFFSLASKSFFMKLAISFLPNKSACANLVEKCSDVNLSNPWVVIYLSWSWSVVILF